MKFYKLIIPFLLIGAVLTGNEVYPTGLKLRAPNWIPICIESYENGAPKTILFYEPLPGQVKQKPVKQLKFLSDGSMNQETDLTILDESDPAVLIFHTRVIPHGPDIIFSGNGTVSKLQFYQKGVLEGLVKSYYPSGALESVANYQKGILEGPFKKLHENGNIAEKGYYKKGKIEGEQICYFDNGANKSKCFFSEG